MSEFDDYGDGIELDPIVILGLLAAGLDADLDSEDPGSSLSERQSTSDTLTPISDHVYKVLSLLDEARKDVLAVSQAENPANGLRRILGRLSHNASVVAGRLNPSRES